MKAFFWYAIALLTILIALAIRRARRRLKSLWQWMIQCLRYRVLVSRGSWSSSTITVPDALLLSTFLAVNALLSIDIPNIANLAILNLVPLYLGGRTNIQADYLGVPLPIYQFAHNWLARVFAAQTLVHSGLKFSQATGWGKVAGLTTAGLIIASLLISLFPVRRWSPTLFRWTHLLLSLIILSGTGIHVVLMTGSFLSLPSILLFTAAGLLAMSWVLRLGRHLYRGRGEITHYDILGHTVRLWVRLQHGIATNSGTYFYIQFPSLALRARFQKHLLPVSFWKATSRGSTKDISFLIPYSQDLATYLQRRRTVRVQMDGPYGEQLGLGRYELVMLVADGEGIAGILSLALSILSRRKYDEDDKAQGLRSRFYCDKTRKVDLIWRLQDKKQVEWASPYFKALSELAIVISNKRKKKIARVRHRWS